MLNGLKQMFMEKDGTTWCFVRCGTAVGQVAFFSLTGYLVHKGTPIDLLQWSMAYSALIIAGATGALAKLKTEDDPK